jgi:hypothetical protein
MKIMKKKIKNEQNYEKNNKKGVYKRLYKCIPNYPLSPLIPLLSFIEM